MNLKALIVSLVVVGFASVTQGQRTLSVLVSVDAKTQQTANLFAADFGKIGRPSSVLGGLF